MLRQYLYATLSLVGALATWHFNLQFMAEQGSFDLMAFLAGGYANAAASSLSSDLAVVVVAFLVWLFAESRRLGMARPWVYAALTFAVAIAFALPLFLFMRERRLAALESAAV